MTTQTAFRARSYTDADLAAVCQLINDCDLVDQRDDNYALEDLRIEFDHPHAHKDRNLRLWEDEAGRLAAFGQLSIAPDPAVVDAGLYVRVRLDSREQGLEEAIFAWGGDRARAEGQAQGVPVTLRSGTRDHDAYGLRVLERHGMAPVRYFFTMQRLLAESIPDPQFPPDYTLRPNAGGAELEHWIDAFNQSFIDHWNHHDLSLEDHQHWLTEPDYNADRDLVAIAPDGTLAAFCFCGVNSDYNTRNHTHEGWIHMLGTRRGYRQIGLGRAMLLAGLQRLQHEGLATAKLSVDAENPTGALRLYESVGFTQAHTWISYRKTL
ncbi:MAG: GNAT family N-acetyltransferase [Chloroflexota bacterium]|nr:GNAT family N-acetyltransferase [Chloroflexota bacterium]